MVDVNAPHHLVARLRTLRQNAGILKQGIEAEWRHRDIPGSAKILKSLQCCSMLLSPSLPSVDIGDWAIEPELASLFRDLSLDNIATALSERTTGAGWALLNGTISAQVSASGLDYVPPADVPTMPWDERFFGAYALVHLIAEANGTGSHTYTGKCENRGGQFTAMDDAQAALLRRLGATDAAVRRLRSSEAAVGQSDFRLYRQTATSDITGVYLTYILPSTAVNSVGVPDKTESGLLSIFECLAISHCRSFYNPAYLQVYDTARSRLFPNDDTKGALPSRASRRIQMACGGLEGHRQRLAYLTDGQLLKLYPPGQKKNRLRFKGRAQRPLYDEVLYLPKQYRAASGGGHEVRFFRPLLCLRG
ncbi:hypothetical protein JCM10296v2_004494 [Rhodotorula toruloides]